MNRFIVQIDGETRYATVEETDLIETVQADIDERDWRFETARQTKKSAAEKLAALGLTEDEINVLVGR